MNLCRCCCSTGDAPERRRVRMEAKEQEKKADHDQMKEKEQ